MAKTVWHVRKSDSTPKNPKTYCGGKPSVSEITNTPVMVELDMVRNVNASWVCPRCREVIEDLSNQPVPPF